MPDTPTIDDVLAFLQESQKEAPSEEVLYADVIIAPRGEPGYYHAEVKTKEGTHPAELTLNLAESVDSLLEADKYGGMLKDREKAGHMFLEELARDVFEDFDGRE